MIDCNLCSTDRKYCKNCSDNPIYPSHSYFKPCRYEPFCPFGFTDCIYDPNYLAITAPTEDIEYCKKECLEAYEAGKGIDACPYYDYEVK